MVYWYYVASHTPPLLTAHPYYFQQGGPTTFWPKQIWWALTWILTHKKENLVEATLKANNDHVSDFSVTLSPLDPFIWLTREDINGKRNLPESSYGSQLCPPYEKICTSIKTFWKEIGLYSKNLPLKVGFFSEIRARRGKIEKIRPLLKCNKGCITY